MHRACTGNPWSCGAHRDRLWGKPWMNRIGNPAPASSYPISMLSRSESIRQNAPSVPTPARFRVVSGSPGSNGPLYIDSPEAANRFLASISNARALALDTEGASFHRYIDRIYLLQLSTDRQHAIIDPVEVEAPGKPRNLVGAPDVEVGFHDPDLHPRLLHQDFGWRGNNIFGNRVAGQVLGIKAFG